MADTPPSFWTTLPGILTGVAALITALVAAATLYLSSTRDEPSETRAAGEGPAQAAPAPDDASTRAQGTPASGSTSGGGPGETSQVTLLSGDWLDIDSGLSGSTASGSEIYWDGRVLFLYGPHNAIVPAETDRGGCTDVLQKRSDGAVDLAAQRTVVVCTSTVDGAIAELVTSPPDATNSLPMAVTVWR